MNSYSSDYNSALVYAQTPEYQYQSSSAFPSASYPSNAAFDEFHDPQSQSHASGPFCHHGYYPLTDPMTYSRPPPPSDPILSPNPLDLSPLSINDPFGYKSESLNLQLPSVATPGPPVWEVVFGRVVRAAHRPLPLEYQSSHSELAPNVEFLKKLREDEEAAQPISTRSELAPARESRSQLREPRNRAILPSTSRPPSLASKPYSSRSPRSSPSDSGDNSPSSSSRRLDLVRNASSTTPPPKNPKEPRKPSLACNFCRERKIACGRPVDDSPDQTCNQCERRSYKCEYKTETWRRLTARRKK